MTPQQQATLRAAILATPALNALISNYQALAAALNAPASPAFVCWQPSIPTAKLGTTIGSVALAAVTSANLNQLDLFLKLNPESFPPSAGIRAFFANTFGGALAGDGQATRDALEALYRLNATVAEKILATGTGSFAAPATFGWQGEIQVNEINGILFP